MICETYSPWQRMQLACTTDRLEGVMRMGSAKSSSVKALECRYPCSSLVWYLPSMSTGTWQSLQVAAAWWLTHHLRLVDESTPTRRARPRGVQRAEVFVALTPPGIPAPANPSDYRYIGGVTRGETTLSFESDKGGMQAHYLSRWVSTSGATGPWSDTTSATVAA